MTADGEAGLPSREAYQRALEAARTAPMRHVPRHIRKEQITAKVHGSGPMGRANAWLAVRITRIVGTMYCAYLFTVIAFVALPSAIHQGSPTILVNWVSSNFLQLVLLPIIIVGQNVISTAQDARAEADHVTLTALHQMNVQQLQLLEGQEAILEALRSRAG
jgi:succinate dehydrogenase hydrophobic anchor subunit